jgi:hypothetical protein
MIVTGAKLSPRQGNLRRDMRNSAAFQAEKTGARTPGMVEAEYAAASRCECHFWEAWRCHQVQAENAARYVQGRQR